MSINSGSVQTHGHLRCIASRTSLIVRFANPPACRFPGEGCLKSAPSLNTLRTDAAGIANAVRCFAVSKAQTEHVYQCGLCTTCCYRCRSSRPCVLVPCEPPASLDGCGNFIFFPALSSSSFQLKKELPKACWDWMYSGECVSEMRHTQCILTDISRTGGRAAGPGHGRRGQRRHARGAGRSPRAAQPDSPERPHGGARLLSTQHSCALHVVQLRVLAVGLAISMLKKPSPDVRRCCRVVTRFA